MEHLIKKNVNPKDEKKENPDKVINKKVENSGKISLGAVPRPIINKKVDKV